MKVNASAADVHENSELQFFQVTKCDGFCEKEKIAVGFIGRFSLPAGNAGLFLSFGEF